MENDHLSSIWYIEAVLLDFDFWKDKIFLISMKPSLSTEIKVFLLCTRHNTAGNNAHGPP